MDKIIKALAFHQTIRIYGIVATTTINEVQDRTTASPEVTVALGKLAMGSLLVGALESFAARIYTKVNGSGPVGNLNADSDAYGNVRAYASHPHVHTQEQQLTTVDVSPIVGRQGFLYIIKDLGLKEYFTSQTALVSGEITGDFAQYFAESQQTPTEIDLDVALQADGKVSIASGFVAQVLPDTPVEIIEALRNNIAKAPEMTTFLAHHSLEDFLQLLTSDTAEILEELPVQFHCNCSKEYFLDAVASLPKKELSEMIKDEHDEEVICQYCGKKYYITNAELRAILDEDE